MYAFESVVPFAFRNNQKPSYISENYYRKLLQEMYVIHKSSQTKTYLENYIWYLIVVIVLI